MVRRASGSEWKREHADGSVLRRVATGVPPTRDPGGFLFAPSSRENRIGKCGTFVYCHSHMLLRVSRTSLLLGLLIVAADCGSESPTKPDSSLVAPSGIATLVVVSGDHQVGVVGNHLGPIEVRALSAAGKGVAERLVVWRRNVAGDSTLVDSLTTDASGLGIVHSAWLTRKPGVQQFTVRSSSAAAVAAEFDATAVADAPSRIEPPNTSGDIGYTGQSVQRPSFRVADVYDNPLPGVHVSFSVDSGGGTLTGVDQVTDSAGRASPASWTLGPSLACNRIRASVGSLAGTFDVFVLSGPPAALTVLAGDGQQAGVDSVVPNEIRVLVTDASNREVTTDSVTWSDGPSGSTRCTSRTLPFGRGAPLQCPWRLGPVPATYTLTVSAGAARTTVSAQALVPPATVDMLGAPPDSTVPVGAAPIDSITLVARLAGGQPAVGYRIAFSFSANFPSVKAITDTRGMAQVLWPFSGFAGRDTLVATFDGFPNLKRTLSVAVVGPLLFQAIAAGGSHSCGTVSSPTFRVYCWGKNANGQLGFDDPATTLAPSRPALVVFGADYLNLASAGAGHSCVDGIFYRFLSVSDIVGAFTSCWGANDNGQAGAAPSAVAPPGRFTETGGVSAGSSHSCAIERVVDATNFYASIPVCWGDNRRGQLGDGSLASSATRVAVDTSQMGRQIAGIAAGDGFSCAITTAGAAWCWGRNDRGQLGDGTTIDRSRPVRVAGGVVFDTHPTAGSFGSPAVPTIVAGTTHACARVSGSLYCWGGNDDGQLGDGTTVSRPAPTAVASGMSFVWFSAGGAHTCALTAGGSAYCWGSNSDGQLGAGTTSARSLSPVAVSGGLTFATVSTGAKHTCATRAAPGGSLPLPAYCWGRNADGQLGDGTTISRSVPVPIAPLRAP